MSEYIEYSKGKKYKVVYDITTYNDPPPNDKVPLMVEISRVEIKSPEIRVLELEARILQLEGK